MRKIDKKKYSVYGLTSNDNLRGDAIDSEMIKVFGKPFTIQVLNDIITFTRSCTICKAEVI